MDSKVMDSNLAAFLDMARHGMTATADDDEHAAYRLAMSAIEDSPCLPKDALLGYAAFAAIAHGYPEYCMGLIHDSDALSDV